jgi:polysaccharide export outer membrane protein
VPIAGPAEDTTLGAGDEFEVRVFGEKDMAATYQVAPDGTIQFPFLGVLQVAGKESNDVATLIADGLRAGGFLNDPQVSVMLTESNSKRISVLGAVAKPGTLPIVPGMTLVNAVSQAGGFTALASKDETVITRRVDGKLVRYRVAVSRITRGDEADFALRTGDIVFVPERVF